MPVTPSGTPYERRATPGGGHEVVSVKASSLPKPKVTPMPVRIVREPRPRALPTNARLGTPVAFLMLAGLVLVYYALHGWDRKYGTFSGAFAGKGGAATGGGTAQAGLPSPSAVIVPSNASAVTPQASGGQT